MKARQNVIVTLRMGHEDMDMELPAFLPIAELKVSILQTLRTLYPRSYSGCKAITLRSNGMILSPTQTLASLGIWDGSILQGEYTKCAPRYWTIVRFLFLPIDKSFYIL